MAGGRVELTKAEGDSRHPVGSPVVVDPRAVAAVITTLGPGGQACLHLHGRPDYADEGLGISRDRNGGRWYPVRVTETPAEVIALMGWDPAAPRRVDSPTLYRRVLPAPPGMLERWEAEWPVVDPHGVIHHLDSHRDLSFVEIMRDLYADLAGNYPDGAALTEWEVGQALDALVALGMVTIRE